MPKRPTPERAAYKSGDAQFDYTIVRSARRKKTIEIAIEPQNGVVVKAPARTPNAEIAGIVHKRAAWILRNTTEDILQPTPRRFTDGETLSYLGREIPIITEYGTETIPEIIAGSATEQTVSIHIERGAFYIDFPDAIVGSERTVSARLEQDAFYITAPKFMEEEQRIAEARKAVERWYRKEAARLLPDMVARWQGKVGGKTPSRVLIRSQRKRWGSCSSDGSIRINWRVIMAEPALMDYVIVHELAHLTVMNHSPRYWKQFERVMPDYRARRKRLNEVGKRFWF